MALGFAGGRLRNRPGHYCWSQPCRARWLWQLLCRGCNLWGARMLSEDPPRRSCMCLQSLSTAPAGRGMEGACIFYFFLLACQFLQTHVAIHRLLGSPAEPSCQGRSHLQACSSALPCHTQQRLDHMGHASVSEATIPSPLSALNARHGPDATSSTPFQRPPTSTYWLGPCARDLDGRRRAVGGWVKVGRLPPSRLSQLMTLTKRTCCMGINLPHGQY